MRLVNRRADQHPASTLEDEVEIVRLVMAATGSRRPPIFAAPSHCPDCGEWGMIDQVDARATYNHCYACSAEWILTRRALTAVAAAPIELHARVREPASAAEFDESRRRHPSYVPDDADTRSVVPATVVRQRPRLRLVGLMGPRVDIVGP